MSAVWLVWLSFLVAVRPTALRPKGRRDQTGPISDDQSVAHSAGHSARRPTSHTQPDDSRAKAASVTVTAISGRSALDGVSGEAAGAATSSSSSNQLADCRSPTHSLTD